MSKLVVRLLMGTGLLAGVCFDSFSQCSLLRQQRDVSFNTDRDCAPVTVTNFTITYYFNGAQIPSDITIRFEWNDPLNSVDEFTSGDPGFIAGGGNTEFTATATFMYPENEDCLFEPAAYIIVNGDLCETSEQIQLVSSWSDDNNFGGTMDVNPGVFEVCFNNPLVNAIFSDNSTFNCNPVDEPDNPNRLDRYTQFVYGTSTPANPIRNLTLNDGSTVNLTDGAGNPVTSTTIDGVTGIHFGPVVHIPFPADGPSAVSFPISAPANAANVVGSEFEVTLFNWNTCNPYNGNPASPNYSDAVMTTAYIRIVAPPNPAYQTRLGGAGGPLQTVFCLEDIIYFQNQTAGSYDYTWEFYDENNDLNPPIGASSATNPTFSYPTPGVKLVRLIATDPDVQSACEVVFDATVTITETAVASIVAFDSVFTAPVNPEFCSDCICDVFTVGFADSTSSIQPETEWRWEFYDEANALESSIPAGMGTYGPRVTDTTYEYSDPGIHRVRILARNSLTLCETADTATVIIYSTPTVEFTANAVCAGERTSFENISDPISSLVPRVNGDSIEVYEWDFSYNGTFSPELTLNDNSDFDWFLDGQPVIGETEPSTSEAGTYTVALRVTTARGMCSGLFTQDITVHPLPEPILTSDYTTPICPDEGVTFLNQSTLAAGIDYSLVVAEGAEADTILFNREDTVIQFENLSGASVFYDVYLLGESSSGCFNQTAPITIEVFPSSPSGFTDLNYNPIGSNCSLWASTLQVNPATQALDADAYTWTISGDSGVLDGYPVVRNSGEVGFHELDYIIDNNFPSNRVYQIQLEVTKTGVCVNSSNLQVVINPQPESAFSVARIDSCEYQLFELTAAQPGLSGYDWTFDPLPDQFVNNSDEQTLLYFRPDAGQPDITPEFSLVTTNLANCQSDPTDTTVLVEAREDSIVVDFTIDPDTFALPETTVNLTNNSSTGPGWTYHWDFDDGTMSAQQHPGTHEFDEPGAYEVTLTVENAFCQASGLQTVLVSPGLPMVEFEADILEGCRPLVVSFTNLTQFADPNTYVWDFGDGATSTLSEPVHTYSRPGTYTVTLSAANIIGEEVTEVKESYIFVYGAPLADFVANPTTVYIPDQQVFFRNRSQEATIYHWDFGDGHTSGEENPVHRYEEEGDYSITLIASNELGCADTLTVSTGVRAITGGMLQTPNAFSPNPDGPTGGHVGSGGAGSIMNDVFMPFLEGVTEFRMLIYNKWGQLLFETTDQSRGWDGYFKGKLMPADVYVYRLELTYNNGSTGIKMGDVTLVR